MLGSVSDIGSSEVCQFGVGGNPQIAAGQKHIEHTFVFTILCLNHTAFPGSEIS